MSDDEFERRFNHEMKEIYLGHKGCWGRVMLAVYRNSLNEPPGAYLQNIIFQWGLFYGGQTL